MLFHYPYLKSTLSLLFTISSLLPLVTSEAYNVDKARSVFTQSRNPSAGIGDVNKYNQSLNRKPSTNPTLLVILQTFPGSGPRLQLCDRIEKNDKTTHDCRNYYFDPADVDANKGGKLITSSEFIEWRIDDGPEHVRS